MQYVNNILCVSGTEIILSERNPQGIISKPLWDKWLRNGVKVIQRACYGKPALVDFNTIPTNYKNLIAEKLGIPQEQAAVKPFKDRVISDPKALTYYSNYMLADGRHLPDEAIREYTANASVLNAIKDVYFSAKEARAKLGKSNTVAFWAKALAAANNIRLDFKHTLPNTDITLQRKFKKYIDQGYEGLISGKYCNDNAQKVSDKIEHLLKSIYAMPNKPFASKVQDLYKQFVTGAWQVVDLNTGEVLDPQQFYQGGQPILISEQTVWNYLNKPSNRIEVDKARMGAHRYNNTHRPHHHRHAPMFSFSKVTMDDRDLPRKCINGKYVKAYYSYDVASGAVVGASYSLHKNEALFIDCMRDMFRLIEREGFGMPMEVEVENHLVNKFFDGLYVMFPFVRICNPGNSQEKHAEHFNRAKKYGIERNTQAGIGRWYAKSEAYTVDRDKINDEFVEKMFTYEQLVADDIKACQDYNNQLHPKQNKYPGKTRWQVLVENLNPNTPQVSKPVVYKAIGEKTETSIRRNQYVTVRGDKFQIQNLEVLNKLAYGNLNIEAYYMPDVDGAFSEVFMFQNNNYVGKAERIVTYNTAKAEQTAQDIEAYTNQSKFVAEFDKQTKEGKKDLAKLQGIAATAVTKALEQTVEVITTQTTPEPSLEDKLNDYQTINQSEDFLDMM